MKLQIAVIQIDEARMATGMRVRVKWRDKRAGEIQDIACFVPEEGP